MANPKRRHSKSRRDKRRATWKLVAPASSICSQCKQVRLPHHVCRNCGFYDGREIIPAAEK